MSWYDTGGGTTRWLDVGGNGGTVVVVMLDGDDTVTVITDSSINATAASVTGEDGISGGGRPGGAGDISVMPPKVK
jgi:hypothetical protein